MQISLVSSMKPIMIVLLMVGVSGRLLGQEKMKNMESMAMSHAFSLNLPMARNGSGTAWSPDASPMYGYMVHASGWMFMFHGDVFPRFNKQDVFNKGFRGGQKWDAPDMLMAMGQRKVGMGGLFHFNVMLSSDAVVTGKSGYPLLFQTGESANGRPLVDRQHPHDLFSELSVSYSQALSKKADVFVYLGYPGEPALGPVTFMHRVSGMFMPDAPIGHHWEDATHITFGVATLGVRYGRFKLEGSSFTGREPDEERYGFDKMRFDSWSGRLSFNPSANWALQVSHGFINSPEELRPSEDVHRTTASATYVNEWRRGSYFAATALWGMNKIAGEEGSNAALLEATLREGRWAFYGRFEWVQKSVEELNLDAAVYGDAGRQFGLNTGTLGLGYDLFQLGHLVVAGGGQASVNRPAIDLRGLYGRAPVGGEIYLHIYPGRM
ncbi:MAG: hypothetical protein JST68_26325 [Bacteroidetes bacterium]|nr:hypothetical protein [Bacteroidota bacterium]